MDTSMMQYMTPEQIQQMAEMDDPEMRMNAMAGKQLMADRMYAKPLQTDRSVNGIAGKISPMEVLGNVATNAAGAYMQNDLAKQYGGMLDKNNAQRGSYAKRIAEALRSTGTTPYTGSEFNMQNGYE